VDAVELLGPYIMGMHAKTALSDGARELGREVPIGQGKVNFPVLIGLLKKIGYRTPSPSSANRGRGAEQGHPRRQGVSGEVDWLKENGNEQRRHRNGARSCRPAGTAAFTILKPQLVRGMQANSGVRVGIAGLWGGALRTRRRS